MVDVIAAVDERFLVAHDLTKASMMLVDDERSRYLMSHIGESFMASGGSVANTSHGLASLGARAGFIGKIADDELGAVFTRDLHEAGVSFFPAPKDHGLPTGRCVIVVTPDGQRTMNTYLGAGAVLHPSDIDRAAVQSAEWVFLEGYLFDKDDAKAAFRVAARYAHEAGRKVALTLSDSFCVQRHHDDFLALVDDEVDLLFANEHELTTLYGTEDFSEAVGKLRDCCPLAVVTRSKRGSAVVTADEFIEVPSLPVDPIVDATGAGDMYAAGFLYGITHGKSLEQSAEIGTICAAEVIMHMGPRPQVTLASLLPEDLR
ncbi:MAG: adenosine kinase [Actinobacteria bacterium]|jgi:sugar/nucleoside kinase (ribokinase family)|nr:adenosine kinase [Actinomycetota bacterium]NDG76553.1 adenosine kinase [Acidimicrobiia bacterium]NBP17206.1 adenosine kinase [Actinomycetota bacterium]NBR76256.1 adenosine kinase [Actinomycetota bacterium]NBY57567.1 adenosine kinase [Actinomycetota bacterium]